MTTRDDHPARHVRPDDFDALAEALDRGVVITFRVRELILNARADGCVCNPGEEWHHPISGHCGGCECLTCGQER